MQLGKSRSFGTFASLTMTVVLNVTTLHLTCVKPNRNGPRKYAESVTYYLNFHLHAQMHLKSLVF